MAFLRPPNVEKLKAKGDIQGLVKALDYQKDATLRQVAVEALGDLQACEAVEPLSAALDDPHEGVCLAAAEALAKIGGLQAVQALTAALESWKKSVPSAAAGALVTIGEPAIPSLIEILQNRKQDVRQLAADALSRIGKPAAEPLIATLDARYTDQCRAAARILTQIGKPATGPLVVALKSENPDRRYQAATILGRIAAGLDDADLRRQAVESLAAMLGDGDSTIRQAAAEALSRFGWQPDHGTQAAVYWVFHKEWERCIELGEPAIAPLQEALRDRDEDVRRCAAGALGQIGARLADAALLGPAVAPLITTLKDRNKEIRQAAAWALGQIGAVQAVEPLLDVVIHDVEGQVRDEADESLKRLGWQPEQSQRGGDYLVAMRQWGRCITLGEPAVAALVTALRDRDKDLRRCSARALGQIGTRLGEARPLEPVVDALVTTLKDPNSEVRQAAAWALGQIGVARAGLALMDALLTDEQEGVRHDARHALLQIGVPAFSLVLQEGREKARQSAVAGLGQIGDDQAIRALVAVMEKDETPAVRRAAARVLEALGWQPARDATGIAYWIARGRWKKCVELGTPAVEPLIDTLADWETSEFAARALAEIGAPAVEPLLAALQDRRLGRSADSIYVALERHAKLVQVLGDIGDRRAVESLISLLDSFGSLRQACIAALACIGAPAVEAVITALEDGQRAVRWAAAQTLVKMYNSGQLEEKHKRRILAQRDRIQRRHQDNRPHTDITCRPIHHIDKDCFGHHGDSTKHEDQHGKHTDTGIGVDFPL